MSTSSSQMRWYVANTQPGEEDNVAQLIIRQNFRCFVPRQVWAVRHAMRHHLKHSAFFPGYLFVSLDLTRDNWRSLDTTIGVRSLIMKGELPLCCPPDFVEHFLDLADENGVLHFETSFAVGRRPRVMHGHFSSLASQLVKQGSNGRVQILLEIMNSNIHVTRDSAPGAFETTNSRSRMTLGNFHTEVR